MCAGERNIALLDHTYTRIHTYMATTYTSHIHTCMHTHIIPTKYTHTHTRAHTRTHRKHYLLGYERTLATTEIRRKRQVMITAVCGGAVAVCCVMCIVCCCSCCCCCCCCVVGVVVVVVVVVAAVSLLVVLCCAQWDSTCTYTHHRQTKRSGAIAAAYSMLGVDPPKSTKGRGKLKKKRGTLYRCLLLWLV